MTSADFAALAKVEQAFGRCRRPRHFADHTHCEECAEHDALLRERDVSSLKLADVGNPGWDPICFISDEGFLYYLPALARLALQPSTEPYGRYGAQFAWHLRSDGRGNDRWRACTSAQRQAVGFFLRHLIETRADLADEVAASDDLLAALAYWTDEGAT